MNRSPHMTVLKLNVELKEIAHRHHPVSRVNVTGQNESTEVAGHRNREGIQKAGNQSLTALETPA